MKSVLVLVSLLAVGQAILLEVPGYATVRGIEGTSHHTGRPFHKFRGLFYGEKPNSLTRFLPPVPFTPDPDTIYGTTGINPVCTQVVSATGGQEDCLLVNVYTPQLPGNASDPNTSYDNLLPVIYWIHGGGFSVGSTITYFPGKFMDRDIVLVEVQYRLGPLGFLSLNTDDIPGNAGMFDQIEGLRWVHKFIKYFGGDPNCVTLAGQSAGGASVTTLLLAPPARGLFHRVIGQSGAIVSPWPIDRDPVKSTTRIAELAGCPTESYADLSNCLRTINDTQLTEAALAYQREDMKTGGLGFGGSSPVIQVAGAQRLFEREPLEILESGDYDTSIPLMMGNNNQEGSLILGLLYDSYLKPNNLTDNYEFLRDDLISVLIKACGLTDESGEMAAALEAKYFVGAEMGNFESMTPGLIDMCSVLFFKDSCHQMVVTHSKFNPNAYWYSFKYEGDVSLWTFMFIATLPPIPHGVAHGDELIYLYYFPFGNGPEETVLSNRMLDVWTNFAKYGDPTPQEVPLTEGVPRFLPVTEDDAFMSIDATWSLDHNYSLTWVNTTGQMNFNQSPMTGYKKP